jgi:hypothetical protein
MPGTDYRWAVTLASTMRAARLSDLGPAQRTVVFRGLGYTLARMTG